MKFIRVFAFLLAFSYSTFCFGQNEIKGTFSAKIIKKVSLNYLLVKPKNTVQKMPLIIFLHGSGERGNDLEKIKNHGPLKYISHDTLNTFILAPQCAENNVWDAEELYLLIQNIIAKNEIDTNRIYLTGLSMGAWGAWNLAYAHPEMFAALVPIAGFVDRIPMLDPCRMKNIPIRIYHGLLDNVVDVQYSMSIYKKLKDCNKDIKLEIFDDQWHDSWTKVYEHAEIYKWLLNQHK